MSGYDHIPRKPEKKPADLNAWGGKKRPISDSIINSENQFRDPPREIGRHMGGPDFLVEMGASLVHRIGLFQGVAWVLPFSGVANDVNYVKVLLNDDGATFDIHLGRVNMDSNWPPATVEILRVVSAVPGSRLRQVYDEETMES